MKWGLVGFGSIGKRHAENIISMGDELIVATKNPDCPYPHTSSIHQLLTSHRPEIIIVCNETSLHEKAYRDIRSFSQDIPLLIEKPLFDKIYDFKRDPHTYVAYCLRFHPLILELRKKIHNEKILSANFYVGQYLPTWRPDRKYQDSYSAKKELGGGVLRDLSHEIDLASFLLGDLTLNFCKNDHISNLEITSDDYFAGFFTAARCSNVVIEMNYLDRIIQRYFILHTNDMSIKVDFINSSITTNQQVETFSFNKNEMYLTMLKNLKNKNDQDFSHFKEGLKILDIISQAEKMVES